MAKKLVITSDIHINNGSGWISQNSTGAAAVWSRNPDNIIVTGDIADTGMREESQTYLNNIETGGRTGYHAKTHFVPGNHDYITDPGPGVSQYVDTLIVGSATEGQITTNNPYYYVDINGWRLFLLSLHPNYDSANQTATMLSWFTSALANTPVGMPMIAVWHTPRFSVDVSHSDLNAGVPRTETENIKPFYSAFHNAGGDLMIHGHGHNNQVFKRQTVDAVPDAGAPQQIICSSPVRNRGFDLTDSIAVDNLLWSLSTAASDNNKCIIELNLRSLASGDNSNSFDFKYISINTGATLYTQSSTASIRSSSGVPSLNHYRIGKSPNNPTSGGEIRGISGSVDSRLHPDTQWVMPQLYRMYALDYGNPNNYTEAPWPNDGVHPPSLGFKKQVNITGTIPSTPSGQVEDMGYDHRGGTKNDIIFANCGNNSTGTNNDPFEIYRIPEPSSLGSSTVIGSAAVSGVWRAQWPAAEKISNGVDCEALVVAPVDALGGQIPAGTVCFIPKSGATPGLYCMPGPLETLTQYPNAVHTLRKRASWTNYGSQAMTRADWTPDGSEIIIARDPSAASEGRTGEKIYTMKAYVFDGSNLSFKRRQDIAVAWGYARYSLTKVDGSYGNESLHFSKDSDLNDQVITVSVDGASNDTGQINVDHAQTVYSTGGGTEPPPPPSDDENVAQIRTYTNAPVNTLDAEVQSGDLSSFVPVTSFAAVQAAGLAGTAVYINTTIVGTSKLRVKTGFGMYLGPEGKLLRGFDGGNFIETFGLNSGSGYINSIDPSHNIYIGGPGEISAQSTSYGGNMLGLGGDNIVLDSFRSNLFTGGRYVVGVGRHWRVRRVNWDANAGRLQGTGVGGLRWMGSNHIDGDDFRCIDSYCRSGDDVWQCVPSGNPNDAMFDVSISDVIYLGCTGESHAARFMVCGLQAAIDDGTVRMHGSIKNVKFIDCGSQAKPGYSGATAISLQNKESDGTIENIEFTRCVVDGSRSAGTTGQPGAIWMNPVTGWVRNITFTDVVVKNHHRPGLRFIGSDPKGNPNLLSDITFIRGLIERSSDPAKINDYIAVIQGTRVSFLDIVLNGRGSSSNIVQDLGKNTVLRYTLGDTPEDPPPISVNNRWKFRSNNQWLSSQIWADPSNKTSPPNFTNLLPNPSFETDTSDWTPTASTTVTRTTTGSAKYGSAYAYLTSEGGTSTRLDSAYISVTPGKAYSAAGWARWRTGATPRSVRLDVEFSDINEATLNATNFGTVTQTSTGSWVQLLGNTNLIAPAGAVYARLRCVVVNAVSGEAADLDGFQLEESSTLPPYNDGSNSVTPDPDPEGIIPYLIQGKRAEILSAATSGTTSFDSPPEAGNLLVVVAAVDKNAGTFTPPTKFTTLASLPSSSVSLYYGYKVSNGTETSITTTWSTPGGNSGGSHWIGEFKSNDLGAWVQLGLASNQTSEANVSSWSSGTTGILSNHGLAISAFAIDSSNSVTSNSALSNGYSIIQGISSSSNRADLVVGIKSVAANADTSTTWSFTGVADQTSGAVAVFNKDSTIYGSSTGLHTFDEFTQQAGAPLQAHRTYRTPEQNVGTWAQTDAAADASRGTVSVLSMKPNMTDLLAGNLDTQFTNFFNAIPTDHTVRFIIWHEPEDDIDNGDFTKSTWKNCQTKMRSLINTANLGRQVQIKFGGNLMAWTANPGSGRDPDTYYPGDNVWDFIAWDGYEEDGQTLDGANIFGSAVSYTESKGLKFAVAEVGVSITKTNSYRRDWILEVRKYAGDNNADFWCYWDGANGSYSPETTNHFRAIVLGTT